LFRIGGNLSRLLFLLLIKFTQFPEIVTSIFDFALFSSAFHTLLYLSFKMFPILLSRIGQHS
jgi:hypothetical protein